MADDAIKKTTEADGYYNDDVDLGEDELNLDDLSFLDEDEEELEKKTKKK